MQHHVHAAPRNAPHMRTSYHHMTATIPSCGQPMSVATATALAPPPPPLQSQPPQQHMREISNSRLNSHHLQQQHHHQITTQTLHSSSTNQMQKIRQQHQHLNSDPNQVVAVPPPQPPIYNSNSHTSHQQQQHQHQQQQQQQQHHIPYNVGHFNQFTAASHQQHMAHVNNYPAGPPIPPMHSGAVHLTQQHQHHYYVANNAKYNNNNNNHNNNNYPSKSNVQNAKRALKSTPKSKPDTHSKGGIVVVSADTSTDATLLSCHSNNIIITPEAMPAIAELPEHTAESSSSPSSSSSSAAAVKETAKFATPTEKSTTTTITTAAESVEDDKNKEDTVEHKIGATLANEDSSVPRNSKDKTPMCLVNELARYNKITHQYRLTGERGPAHSKTFTVTLRLGEEEYSADGFKIKKAQHVAAAKAIEETKFKHPPPKTRRNEDGSGGRMHITPTVELNALAMKLGQRTYYLLDPTQIPPPNTIISQELIPQPHMLPQGPQLPHGGGSGGGGAYMRRSGSFVPAGAVPPPYMQPGMPPPPQPRYKQRGYPPKYPPPYPMPPQMGGHMVQPHGPFAPLPTPPSKITLFVGKQKFVGVGRTLQQAKHDAAARALQLLKAQSKTNPNEDSSDDLMDEDDKKSPISQVHEIGIKRNMTVHFKVIREEGPAHMKNYITGCIVGPIVTEGEGNGKKISKKRAAEKMVTELQKLPPLSPSKQPFMKRIKVKTPSKPVASSSAVATPNPKGEKRKRAILKEKKPDVEDIENPITKLIRLQQSRKEKEPIFELIAKNGNENSRRREFIMEVTAGSMVARGTGHNKKLAKRNAALSLLNLMEVPANDNKENAGDQTAQLKTSSSVNTAVPASDPAAAGAAPMAEHKKIDVPMISTPAGPVPGILILRQNKKHAAKKKESASVKQTNVETIQTKQDEPIEDGGDTKTNNSTTNKSTTNESATVQNSSADTSTSTTNTTENNDNNSKTSSSATVATTSATVASTSATVATTSATVASTSATVAKTSATVASTSATVATTSATVAAATTTATDTSNSAIDTSNSTTDTSNSATSEATSNESDENASSTNTTTNNIAAVHMKEQLLYLSKLLGFDVHFNDYPKGNHKEFLTIVTLSSEPPQICHGVGSNAEESHNDAAQSALQMLSKLGLNNTKKSKK